MLDREGPSGDGGSVRLSASCPRCSAPVTEWEGTYSCVDHGVTPPLWRPREVTYEAFGDLLHLAPSFPTYLPWPMSPGWSVSDFAVVAETPGTTRGSVAVCSGTSEIDGQVDVFVVAEEPGTGLGSRCAGMRTTDPGHLLGDGPPTVRVRIGSVSVPLWLVSTSDAAGGTVGDTAGDTARDIAGDLDRAVVAGEAAGRWLWLVLRPASAILLLGDDWILTDASELGPPLVETPFGGTRPEW